MEGEDVTVASDVPQVLEYLRLAFGDLAARSGRRAAPDSEPTRRPSVNLDPKYVVRRWGSHVGVWPAGCTPVFFDSSEEAAEYVQWHASHTVLTRPRDELALHAAAVSIGRRALVLVGASGSGKSTITVELLRRGYGFLSDEAVFISPPTAQVRGFARAIGLISWREPGSSSAGRAMLKTYRRPGEFGAPVVRDWLTVAALVILDGFEPFTKLEAVPAARVVPDLVPQVFSSGPATVVMAALTRFVSSTRAFRLTMGDPAEVCGVLADLAVSSPAAWGACCTPVP